MKTVYFVRHGESEANAGAPRFQGETSHLTAHGKEQAEAIAERCKRLDFELLISSMAIRARETVQRIAEATNKTPVFDDTFTERKLPRSLIGKLREEPAAHILYTRWEQSLYDANIKVEDGENFSDIQTRAGRALEYLESRQESHILVVTHGFFLRTIIARILFGATYTPEEFKRIIATLRTSNTGLTVLQHNAGAEESWAIRQNPWVIRAWNDHAHLG